MEINKNIYKTPLIILAIIILIAAVVSLYMLFSARSTKNIAVSVHQSEVTSSTAITVPDWQTYENDESGFAFQYPTDKGLKLQNYIGSNGLGNVNIFDSINKSRNTFDNRQNNAFEVHITPSDLQSNADEEKRLQSIMVSNIYSGITHEVKMDSLNGISAVSDTSCHQGVCEKMFEIVDSSKGAGGQNSAFRAGPSTLYTIRIFDLSDANQLKILSTFKFTK